MSFFDVLETLCTQNNTSVTAVLKELGYSTSKGTAWRNGSIPTGDILLNLAEHFNISVDYLLGRTDDINSYKSSIERNSTMIKNGRPYTNEHDSGFIDDELITLLSNEEIATVRKWISDHVKRSKKIYPNTSYGIKHLLESDTGIYLTNNQFKDAMLLEGYKPINPNELNWEYRISIIKNNTDDDNVNDNTNFTLDYLIDKEKSIYHELSEDKQRLLKMYDLLTDMEKGEILGELKMLTKDIPMAAVARSTGNSMPTKPSIDNLDDFPTMDEE